MPMACLITCCLVSGGVTSSSLKSSILMSKSCNREQGRKKNRFGIKTLTVKNSASFWPVSACISKAVLCDKRNKLPRIDLYWKKCSLVAPQKKTLPTARLTSVSNDDNSFNYKAELFFSCVNKILELIYLQTCRKSFKNTIGIMVIGNNFFFLVHSTSCGKCTH